MTILLIFVCVAVASVQQALKKEYIIRCTGGGYFFSAVGSLFALIFFLLTAGKINFSAEILPYSIGFAVVYALANIYAFMSIKIGSLAITSLILSYSLIIPTLYGFLFLNEKITALKCGGILFLLISIFLVRSETKGEEKIRKLTAKWIIYVLIAFVANGMCSVIQNAQQVKFQGTQNSNFMILALMICTVIFFILSYVFERNTMLNALKKGTVWAAVCGLCNGATNYLVLVIIAVVASSVFFPVISAGQVILTFIFSVVLYKEKFIPRQVVGLACGLISLILLNI